MAALHDGQQELGGIVLQHKASLVSVHILINNKLQGQHKSEINEQTEKHSSQPLDIKWSQQT